MPFTLAHVVAARPLWRAARRSLPLSGLVVGSVAPDLEYLAHLDTERTIGHQLHGVVLLDLPSALVLLALWHGLIKRPVSALVMNYASTAVGLVLLGWWWWRAVEGRSAGADPQGAPPLPARVRRVALATLVVLIAAGGIGNGVRLRLDGWGIETTVIGAVLGAMAAGLVATTVVSAALRAGPWRA